MTQNNYLLTESLIGGISIYMIMKRLTTDFKDWDACKLGIINDKGEKKKHPTTAKEREAWDILTRFCWNIKKIASKFIGKSKFASYFTAAYLLKDSLTIFYVTKNQERLNETLLSDISFAKQLVITDLIKKININEKVTEETLELKMFQYYDKILAAMLENKEIFTMFEEDAPAPAAAPTINTGTVAADIAQHGQYLGVRKKDAINPMKIVKKDLKHILKSKKKRKKK